MATGGFGSRLFDWLALRPNGLCVIGHGGATTPTGLSLRRRRRARCPGVVDGAYWQLVTSMFTHVADLAHRASTCSRCGCSAPSSSCADRPGAVPGALLPLRAGRLGAGAVGRPAVRRHPRRLGRDLRPDGRPAGGRAQGRRRRPRDPDLDRHQLRRSRCSSSTTSPGRATSAASSAALAVAAVLVYAPARPAAHGVPGRRPAPASRVLVLAAIVLRIVSAPGHVVALSTELSPGWGATCG